MVCRGLCCTYTFLQCRAHGMITRQCLTRRTAQSYLPGLPLHPRRPFHPSSCRRDDGMPDHYTTLGVAINASPGEIKKYAIEEPTLIGARLT